MAESDDDALEPYNKGYTHEILHTAYVLLDTWEAHVIDTRTCEEFKDVKEAAERAHQAMFDVYTLLGRKMDEADEHDTD